MEQQVEIMMLKNGTLIPNSFYANQVQHVTILYHRNFVRETSINLKAKTLQKNFYYKRAYKEQSDEHGHSSGHDLRRDEKADPRDHNEQARGKVVHVEIFQLVSEFFQKSSIIN